MFKSKSFTEKVNSYRKLSKEYLNSNMRAAILFVVGCAVVGVAFGQGLGGSSPLEPSQWSHVSEKVSAHLVQLESQLRQQWKLVEFKNVNSQVISGFKYDGTAEFENAEGEKHTCSFSLTDGEKDYEKLDLTCGGKTYTVTKGEAQL